MNDSDRHIYTAGDYEAVADGQRYWVVHTPTGTIKDFFRTESAAAKAAVRFYRKDQHIRPSRVTPEEHIAFKAEMQTLRHIVRKVRSMRLK